MLVVRLLLPHRAPYGGVRVVAERMALAGRRRRGEPLLEEALLGEAAAGRRLLTPVAEGDVGVVEGGESSASHVSYSGYTCALARTARSHEAAAKPTFSARPKEKSSGAIWTIVTGNAAAIASVASVEPESTITISSGTTVCRLTPVNRRPICASSLKQRMTSATVRGMGQRVSPP